MQHKDLTNKLIDAIISGDADKCKVLLDSGAKVNWDAGDGFTALFYAAMHGHADICKMILDAETHVNWKKIKKPLFEAVRGGFIDVCKVLFNAGVQIENYIINQLLSHAIEHRRANICRFLIESGADIKTSEKDWLGLAVHSGSADVCKVLLDAGVHVDEKALTCKLFDMVYYGNANVCNVLFNAGVRIKESTMILLLHQAVKYGHADVCMVLLKAGAPVNGMKHDVRLTGKITIFTPLYQAVKYGYRMYNDAHDKEKRFADTVTVLLGYGARLDAVDNEGNSAIEISKKYGTYDLLMSVPAVLSVLANKKAIDTITSSCSVVSDDQVVKRPKKSI